MYGVVALSCGDVTAVTTPTFEPTTQLNLTWRWNILKEQIIPPGADVWWQWHITTADGSELTTPKQTVTFLDTWFVWQSVTEENLTVHWYRGSRDMANHILKTGVAAIYQLADDTGLHLSDTINLYLYEEPFDLQVSVPGAPGWAGGAAFPEYSLILAVAHEDYLSYSEETVRHEVGHLVIERLAFNCLQPLPTWLSEGLAMVAEGPDSDHMDAVLASAVEADTLFTPAQLAGPFSTHSDQARLSYAQSYSMVRFLLDTGSPVQMESLLFALRDGTALDDALMNGYGLDTFGLETAWREQVGATAPQPADAAADVLPTAVPTLALAAPATAVPPTDTPVPTPTMQTPITAVATAVPPPQSAATLPPANPPQSAPSNSWLWLSLASAAVIIVTASWLFIKKTPRKK